jgi:hypothetical protein
MPVRPQPADTRRRNKRAQGQFDWILFHGFPFVLTTLDFCLFFSESRVVKFVTTENLFHHRDTEAQRGMDRKIRRNDSSSVSWFAAKFNEPCRCKSGKPYRECCYMRELVYFLIAVFAAYMAFGFFL